MKGRISQLLGLIIVLSACTNAPDVEVISYVSPYKFNVEIFAQIEADSNPLKYQMAAMEFALKGEYQKALEQFDVSFGLPTSDWSDIQKDSLRDLYSVKPAMESIIDLAEDYKITIINEAHHDSRHRVFTTSLLKDFYDLGYRHLGLEALGNGEYLDSTLNERKYPVLSTGYYTKDPHFGNMIREALDLGFNVFAYETTSDLNFKEREISQAQNIVAEMEKYPNDKFLIHCGFDHATEGSHRSFEKAMAERLKEYTDIDPLTINQVVYSSKSNPDFNHPLLKTFDQQSPFILSNKGQVLGYVRGEGWFDVAVFHPEQNLKVGVPTVVPVNTDTLDYPVMVLAFESGENTEDAVPIALKEFTGTDNELTIHSPYRVGSFLLKEQGNDKSYRISMN